ncbi:type II secretion system protein [Paraferrimonas sedimenticola]|uniref:Type IV pilin n=1 Tax=Paraferrimonas sedimenticola TaxID=375674 RepID=A0AA37VX59_9GAMM|nr:type II secretion system protein [Paraferrimonas sedimenticola]GLP95140.1 type IV pilin [Paraferrimonas sedimenticola]
MAQINSMARKSGFTLIELVVVIVILGLLAVVAAPKFINLRDDAMVAKLEGMQGAMKSGARLIYAKAAVENKLEGNDSITEGNASISLNSGYPVANWMDGIRYIVDLDVINYSGAADVCDVDWCGRGNQTSIPSGVTTTSPGRIGKVYPKGYSWNDQCGVYYLNHEDGRTPEIGLETADC